jgi:hypothetical protein
VLVPGFLGLELLENSLLITLPSMYPQRLKHVSQVMNTVRAATQNAEQKGSRCKFAKACQYRAPSLCGWYPAIAGQESEGMMRGGVSVVMDQLILTSLQFRSSLPPDRVALRSCGRQHENTPALAW